MANVADASAFSEETTFLRLAYACAFIAFGGFSFTYFAPVVTGTFEGPAVLHLHGILSSAWMVLVVVQAALIGSGQGQRHRTVGIFGIALATAMMCTVLNAGLDGLHSGIKAGVGKRSA